MKKIVVFVLLLLIPSWAFAETKQVKSAKAFDVTGKLVGEIVDSPQPTVILEVDGVSFPLAVFRDELAGSILLFVGSGCTGMPFLPSFELDFDFPTYRRIVGVNSDNIVHIADSSQAPRLEDIGSTFFITCVDSSSPFTTSVMPTVTIIDLDDFFMPPYSLDSKTRAPIW